MQTSIAATVSIDDLNDLDWHSPSLVM